MHSSTAESSGASLHQDVKYIGFRDGSVNIHRLENEPIRLIRAVVTYQAKREDRERERNTTCLPASHG